MGWWAGRFRPVCDEEVWEDRELCLEGQEGGVAGWGQQRLPHHLQQPKPLGITTVPVAVTLSHTATPLAKVQHPLGRRLHTAREGGTGGAYTTRPTCC